MQKCKKFSTFFLVIFFLTLSFSSFCQEKKDLASQPLDQETMDMFMEALPDYASTMKQLSPQDLEKAQKQLQEMLAENDLTMEDFQPLANKILMNFSMLQSGGFNIDSLSSQEIPKELLDEMNLIQEYMPQMQEALKDFLPQDQKQ